MRLFDDTPPPITPEAVAAAVDRLVPAVFRYLDDLPLAQQPYDMHFTALSVLLSQYADPHSRYHRDPELPARAWRELACELAKPQPQFSAYDTGFIVWELFDCFRAAEAALPPDQVEQLRALFRPLGELLLADPRDFASDDRINPALLRATDLAVCGWALDDDRMRRESERQAAEIIADRCDENGIPSELSISYDVQMVHWLSQACEIAPRPDLLQLLRGLCRAIPWLIYQPTLDLMGPDCRDPWKTPCWHNIDALVVGLRAAAVLLSDGESEWLSRAFFHHWAEEGNRDRAVYTPRAPSYVGCERYEIGWGPTLGPEPRRDAADSPRLVTVMQMRAGQLLCALKRWLGPEVAARRPAPPDEYRSSRRYLRRYRKGDDVAALANLPQPLSYLTPTFGLQGHELWTDDWFFWFNLAGFHPTAYSEDGFCLSQSPNPKALPDGGKDAPDRVLHGAARYRDHLISLTRIDCFQDMEPGIVSWAGLLLMADREGEVIFGRGDEIGRGRVLEEQRDCDWILYPCDERRRFGFGLLALRTTGRSHRLANFSGDWCVLGLSDSPDRSPGLQALGLLIIGPWSQSPEAYAAWLRAWRVEETDTGCTLHPPTGPSLHLPYPPPP